MTDMDKALEERCVNTLRFLAVDSIEKANSGHPGMPLGAAAMAQVVWHDFLRYDPQRPDWFGRDRFVLSAGHASGLLYALLHCAGVGLELDELKQFRQWGSRTPGHPEYGLTPGVETTTGPLGQGFGNGIGMAIAARLLAARFGEDRFGHRVFGIVSDGDLMEGLSQEAASMAGHLGLSNLVYLYDSNEITIEGATSIAVSDDVVKRFEAIGWFVQYINGLNLTEIRAALEKACAEPERPSLIIGRTHIGYGSPKVDTPACHGSPLGADAMAACRETLGWPSDTFHVPDEVREVWSTWAERNAVERERWERSLDDWRATGSEDAKAWDALASTDAPNDLLEQLVESVAGLDAATRVSSGKVLNRAAQLLPSVIGGSADLAPSTKTLLADEAPITTGLEGFKGRNFHFGIREHAMASVANGMALHGPWKPYVATFMVFTDYMRPAMRLAAMMGLPVTYVMTHDSFFVGEDGPTHQPVEHLWALRVIPRLPVLRPADGLEVAAAWTIALESRDSPHVLALSRQGLPALDRPAGFDPRVIERGAYLLSAESGETPELIFVATGSEVSLAVEAKAILVEEGLDVRVVSMPCVEFFTAEDSAYQADLLPAGVPRVVIEAGVSAPWHAVVGADALILGLDDFGASAPNTVLREKFGFTAGQVAARVKTWLETRTHP